MFNTRSPKGRHNKSPSSFFTGTTAVGGGCFVFFIFMLFMLLQSFAPSTSMGPEKKLIVKSAQLRQFVPPAFNSQSSTVRVIHEGGDLDLDNLSTVLESDRTQIDETFEFGTKFMQGIRQCSDDCVSSGNYCWFGKCYCKAGYTGDRCETKTVPVATCGELDDSCLWSKLSGTMHVHMMRWKSAQMSERITWASKTAAMDTDRNDLHAISYGNYRRVPSRLGKFVEIGCGPYTQSKTMFQARKADASRVYLVDPNVVFYSHTVKNCAYANGKYLGRIEAALLPIGGEEFNMEEQFDTVLMTNVIEHVLNGHQVMHNMLNAVKPGGMLIFHEFSWDAYTGKAIEERNFMLHPVRISAFYMYYIMSLLDVVHNVDGSISKAIRNFRVHGCGGEYVIGYRITRQEVAAQQLGLRKLATAKGVSKSVGNKDYQVLAATQDVLLKYRGIINAAIRSMVLDAPSARNVLLCENDVASSKKRLREVDNTDLKAILSGVAESPFVKQSNCLFDMISTTNTNRIVEQVSQLASLTIEKARSNKKLNENDATSWLNSPIRFCMSPTDCSEFPRAPVHYRQVPDAIVGEIPELLNNPKTLTQGTQIVKSLIPEGVTFVDHRRTSYYSEYISWSEISFRFYTVVIAVSASSDAESIATIANFYTKDPGCDGVVLVSPTDTGISVSGVDQPDRVQVIKGQSKFSPNLPIRTEAVLLHADNVLPDSLSTVSCLYASFLKSPWAISGMEADKFYREPQSVGDIEAQGEQDNNYVKTSMAFVNYRWLVEYSAEEHRTLREVATVAPECEDMAFNAIVSLLANSGPRTDSLRYRFYSQPTRASFVVPPQLGAKLQVVGGAPSAAVTSTTTLNSCAKAIYGYFDDFEVAEYVLSKKLKKPEIRVAPSIPPVETYRFGDCAATGNPYTYFKYGEHDELV